MRSRSPFYLTTRTQLTKFLCSSLLAFVSVTFQAPTLPLPQSGWTSHLLSEEKLWHDMLYFILLSQVRRSGTS